jgi:hypothetical protein
LQQNAGVALDAGTCSGAIATHVPADAGGAAEDPQKDSFSPVGQSAVGAVGGGEKHSSTSQQYASPSAPLPAYAQDSARPDRP